jgi:phosphatidate cytidylyltransferase
MLKWRLLLGTAIVLALVGLCWLDAQSDLPAGIQKVPIKLPGVALMPLVLILAALATQEVLRLARAANLNPAAPAIYFGNLLLVIAQWLPAVNLYVISLLQNPLEPSREFDYMTHVEMIWAGSHSALWALSLGVIMIFVAEMRRFERPGGALANIAVGVFSLIYVGVMLTFAVQMRIFWGVGAVAAWIVSVKMGDIGAYTVGRLIGTTRMSPTISPGKTTEGAMGAILFACIGSWISFHGIVQLAPPSVALNPGTPFGWLVFGLVMGIAGIVGDLSESLLKRDVGVKDSSAWMPGFGGVLDILDSLLLSAPIAWLCWAFNIVGIGQPM